MKKAFACAFCLDIPVFTKLSFKSGLCGRNIYFFLKVEAKHRKNPTNLKLDCICSHLKSQDLYMQQISSRSFTKSSFDDAIIIEQNIMIIEFGYL